MNDKAEISIDLKKDWIEILRSRLQVVDYSIPIANGWDEVTAKYLNVLKRRIDSHPRTVLTSAEFTCPEEREKGLALIARKAEKGDDLNLHQSKRLLDPSYNDPLLNDWGLYHFHLGTILGRNGLIERSGPLLFARVTETHVYLIDVMGHGDWTRKRFIEIMHNNWPDSMSDYKYPDAIGLESNVSEDDVRRFRNAGVDYAIQLSDGTVYGPIGGGYTMSGLSTDVAVTLNSYFYFLQDCENYVKNNINELVNIAKSKGVELRRPFLFRLGVSGNDFYAIETNSKFGFLIGKDR
jgi:hypothetical protein